MLEQCGEQLLTDYQRVKELPLEERHKLMLDLHSSPETDAIRNAQARRLRKMIDGLPEDLRQVLLLSAIEELNSREVGLLIGVQRALYARASCAAATSFEQCSS